MGLHTSLPIYKVTYDLFALTAALIRNMPRDLKVSLGGKLRDECLELVLRVYRANVARDKVQHLTELLEHLQVTELVLRLAKDLRAISLKQYAAAVALTDKIGKQATGWRKHSAASPAA